ncbi:MAG: 50S ribosomal protein L15 [Verrucomicrobia bacterium]|nr:50S ribosomal protein L15 [Verrucomicrobiota bacterium]
MITLSDLSNTHRPHKGRIRCGRGPGSKKGKTCGRGNKGDRARRGFKTHKGQEGGQMPLYKKLPGRGFTNGRFKAKVFSINLSLIDKLFNDGETVNLQALQQKGVAPRRITGGLKILSGGEITKKLAIHAVGFSEAAIEKLKAKGIPFEQIPLAATDNVSDVV